MCLWPEINGIPSCPSCQDCTVILNAFSSIVAPYYTTNHTNNKSVNKDTPHTPPSPTHPPKITKGNQTLCCETVTSVLQIPVWLSLDALPCLPVFSHLYSQRPAHCAALWMKYISKTQRQRTQTDPHSLFTQIWVHSGTHDLPDEQ